MSAAAGLALRRWALVVDGVINKKLGVPGHVRLWLEGSPVSAIRRSTINVEHLRQRMGQRLRHASRQRSLEPAVLRACGHNQRDETDGDNGHAFHC